MEASDSIDIDGMQIVRLDTDLLQVDICPQIGGRIVNILHKPSGHQFLWHNQDLKLQPSEPGQPYDPCFYGGIDEVLPTDLPEMVNGIACADHGEMWTLPLEYQLSDDALTLSGTLPVYGLHYQKRLSMDHHQPVLHTDYRIHNPTDEVRSFMWKPHAALTVEAGDIITCPATTATALDTEWSYYDTTTPFPWPVHQDHDAGLVPPADGSAEFLLLSQLQEGRIECLVKNRSLRFAYTFDTNIFPWGCFFSTYGKLDNHYTVILEPCSCSLLSVAQAASEGLCTSLSPGETLETRIDIFAGSCQ